MIKEEIDRVTEIFDSHVERTCVWGRPSGFWDGVAAAIISEFPTIQWSTVAEMYAAEMAKPEPEGGLINTDAVLRWCLVAVAEDTPSRPN